MRLLSVLIVMIISTSANAAPDIYDEDGVYVGKTSLTSGSVKYIAINNVMKNSSAEFAKYKKAVRNSYDAEMKNSVAPASVSTCDDACKKEVQAEIIKKYGSTTNNQ